jgi:large subunit ribosomal protein L19
LIYKIFCVRLKLIMTGNKITKIKFSPVDIEERQKLDFKAGDTISVWSKIAEEKISTKANKKDEKTIKYRLQAFEGIVLARKHGTEPGATFTVRKIASGVGVERIFPLYSPTISKIEITKRSRARRSKLYYIRTKAIKDVRNKMRSVVNQEDLSAEAEETETTEKVAE